MLQPNKSMGDESKSDADEPLSGAGEKASLLKKSKNESSEDRKKKKNFNVSSMSDRYY